MVKIVGIRSSRFHVSRECRSLGCGRYERAAASSSEQTVESQHIHTVTVGRESQHQEATHRIRPNRPNDVELGELPLSELFAAELKARPHCRSRLVERSWRAKCISDGHLRLLEGSQWLA